MKPEHLDERQMIEDFLRFLAEPGDEIEISVLMVSVEED